MNSSFNEGGQFAWDATSLSLWQTCPRKYYYKNIEGWQARELSVHLLFGGLYASALEHFHKHRAEGKSHEEALFLVVKEALVNSWDHEKGEPLPFIHNAKTRPNLIRSIIWYFEHFEDDPCQTIILKDGRPAVELSFTIPVDDGIVFCGHMDRIVLYMDDPYGQDQKTTGHTVDSIHYFAQFNPDTQMTMYTFAGNMILGTPVKGVMIDAAQIAVGFTRFGRSFTPRTEDQLNEWYDNMMYHIETARRLYQARDGGEAAFPMNLASCGNYGGCEFRRVCSSSPHVRENFLRAEFTKGETWNPLERR